jgi:hypothetical protein
MVMPAYGAFEVTAKSSGLTGAACAAAAVSAKQMSESARAASSLP